MIDTVVVKGCYHCGAIRQQSFGPCKSTAGHAWGWITVEATVYTKRIIDYPPNPLRAEQKGTER
jgi:hypothetical protein